MKRLTIKWLTERLLEEGCLEKRYQDGLYQKYSDGEREEAGIRAEERISAKGILMRFFFIRKKDRSISWRY